MTQGVGSIKVYQLNICLRDTFIAVQYLFASFQEMSVCDDLKAFRKENYKVTSPKFSPLSPVN